MPLGTPYHSFALPYPIRVDNFTDTIHDLPPPYNRPRLHLLTHTHSDHIKGLASKSFAYHVICSPDAKEMLLRHEEYAERSLYDHEYRTEKRKTFGHLKIDPYAMLNGRKLFIGSRDLLHAIPLNTPTEFDISNSEIVTITLIDANHCPGSVMFLIEGPRGAVLHTGDLRAEPWLLSSIQRNHFLQPYLASYSEDLRIFVARREGTHPEAMGLVKTLEAIYLDTASLLSPVVVPTKEYAVQGIVGLIALFPSSTYFFINAWTWGYEDVLKAIARAFHCKIHLDRYKYSIYSNGLDPLLCALGTRDPTSTRFHACERFDRCSFVDVAPYDYGTKGAVAPPSKEGKKVVYVNVVNMSCSRWEDYQANVRRQVLQGENVDSLLVPLSRHSPLPELMNFVTMFRPHRVVPNTLDPSLNGLDWGAMSKMFSGCLSPASSPGCLVSVMAPPCPLTCHLSVISLPGPSTKYDSRKLSTTGEERVDTTYSNLIGPSDTAEKWSERNGKKELSGVLSAWIGTGRRKGLRSTYRRIVEDEDAFLNEHGLEAGPSRVISPSGITPETPRKYARSDDSGDSSDEGGSDEHVRTAWKLFGVGEIADTYRTRVTPSPRSEPQTRAEAVADIKALPTPTSSPLLRERGQEGSNKDKELTMGHVSQNNLPSAVPLQSSLRRVSTEVIFEDTWFSEEFPVEQTKEAVGSGSQPFVRLDNVLFDPSQDSVSISQCQSLRQQTPRLHQRNIAVTEDADNISLKRNIENVSKASPVKRQRIGREEWEADMCEKGDPSGSVGRKLAKPEGTQPIPCGRERICALPHKPSPVLTHIPTVPLVSSMEVSLTPTSSTPEVEDTLIAVSATPTISFPAKKHIERRADHTVKSKSPTVVSSHQTGTRKGLVTGLASTIAHASTSASSVQMSAITRDTSTHTGGTPVSPQTAARRADRAKRRRITEKLRQARPDLVRAQSSSTSAHGMDVGKGETSIGNGKDMMSR